MRLGRPSGSDKGCPRRVAPAPRRRSGAAAARGNLLSNSSYWAEVPPSTGISAPVMKLASAEATKATTRYFFDARDPPRHCRGCPVRGRAR